MSKTVSSSSTQFSISRTRDEAERRWGQAVENLMSHSKELDPTGSGLQTAVYTRCLPHDTHKKPSRLHSDRTG